MRYSTNPKMDDSGIRAEVPDFHSPDPRATKTVTGGKLYMKALRAQEDFKKGAELTRTNELKGYAKDLNAMRGTMIMLMGGRH